MPLCLAGAKVAHPLLVVANLLFPLLIGTDILRPYAATLSLGDASPPHLNARVCDVFLEQQTDSKHEYRNEPAVACTTEPDTIGPIAIMLVSVRVPRAAQEAATITKNLSIHRTSISGALLCLQSARQFLLFVDSQSLMYSISKLKCFPDFQSQQSTCLTVLVHVPLQLPCACPTNQNCKRFCMS